MQFVITQADEGKLLRTFLREQGVSAALCARLKRLDDGICLNGSHVTVRATLHAGDLLELAVEEREPPLHILPRDIPVDVVQENDDLLVVNKAADMPTHPSHGHFEDTLANGLAYRYAKNGVPFRPRFVNRLDRNTTGLVLVARHALAAAQLGAAMSRGEIQKTYIALVGGRIDAPRVIESGIRRREESIIFRETCPIGEGEYAKTEVVPLAWCDELSLVRLIPHTGRTHQLRVHLSSVGHPLLGDELYGGDLQHIGRHALHAATLALPMPRTGERITVSAPLPADMETVIKMLGEEAVTLAKAECAQTGQEIR